MDALVNSIDRLVTWLQYPAWSLFGLCLIIGGYYFMSGGRDGREKAKMIWISGTVGLFVVLGVKAIVSNVKETQVFGVMLDGITRLF